MEMYGVDSGLLDKKVADIQQLTNEVLNLRHGDKDLLEQKERALFGTINTVPFRFNYDRMWLQYLVAKQLDEIDLHTPPGTINIAHLVYEELPKHRGNRPPENLPHRI